MNNQTWSGAKLFLREKQVQIVTGPGRAEDVVTGQALMSFSIPDEVAEMKKLVASFERRKKSDLGGFSRRRGVAMNSEVIRGTRIPISAIKAYIDSGADDETILAEYPTLTVEDIASVRKLAA